MTTEVSMESRDGTRWFLGTAIRIVASASDGNDDICIVEHRMPAGDAPPLHVHRNEDETFFVIEGRLRLDVAGRTTMLDAGQSAVAPKGVPHGYRVESAGARVLTVTRGHDFETMLRAMSRPADGAGLPPPAAPTPEMIAALTDACRRNGIDIVGPPVG